MTLAVLAQCFKFSLPATSVGMLNPFMPSAKPLIPDSPRTILMLSASGLRGPCRPLLWGVFPGLNAIHFP
jgi:hypothetical protein